MTHHPTTIPGIILAGGRATRMGGGDKCLLDLGGRPMLARIIDRLAPQCAPLALNANGDPARFAGFGLPVIADSLSDHPGPLAGILAGMDWAAGMGATRILSVAGDTPFFPSDLALRLDQAGHGIVLAASRVADGQVIAHPTFGLWPTDMRDDLRAFLASGHRRVRAFAAAHGAASAVWEADPDDPFFNINTPADLDRARSRP
ncbi:molybdenum cofactor guanylyltransferase MobA [uncultured Paracoccus sp.]|uniref:molybdenum cofactor guanylyltransferase MobA n=1 Tax=uncultured Paracoccus sp. TaxID=189685 RepID=UPI0025FF8005|nr:molybdenum cofactor guanylyltransferase MobA [uncultured Paracoccus sp.]